MSIAIAKSKAAASNAVVLNATTIIESNAVAALNTVVIAFSWMMYDVASKHGMLSMHRTLLLQQMLLVVAMPWWLRWLLHCHCDGCFVIAMDALSLKWMLHRCNGCFVVVTNCDGCLVVEGDEMFFPADKE